MTKGSWLSISGEDGPVHLMPMYIVYAFNSKMCNNKPRTDAMAVQATTVCYCFKCGKGYLKYVSVFRNLITRLFQWILLRWNGLSLNCYLLMFCRSCKKKKRCNKQPHLLIRQLFRQLRSARQQVSRFRAVVKSVKHQKPNLVSKEDVTEGVPDI